MHLIYLSLLTWIHSALKLSQNFLPAFLCLYWRCENAFKASNLRSESPWHACYTAISTHLYLTRYSSRLSCALTRLTCTQRIAELVEHLAKTQTQQIENVTLNSACEVRLSALTMLNLLGELGVYVADQNQIQTSGVSSHLLNCLICCLLKALFISTFATVRPQH